MIIECVLNKSYGGFQLSGLALKKYFQKKNMIVYAYQKNDYSKTIDILDKQKYSYITLSYLTPNQLQNRKSFNTYDFIYEDSLDRTDKDLIQVVRQLGQKANTRFSDLRIVGIQLNIHNYDGFETIQHQVEL